MQKILLAVAVATLTACGGGGGSSSPTPEPSPPAVTNAAPQANDAIVTGVNGGLVKPGDVLSFGYKYSDAENDAEGESRIQWLLNNEIITGAVASEYSVLAGQGGQQISARITPVALTGETEGVAAHSNALTVAIDGAPVAENIKIQNSQDRFKPGAVLSASYDYTDVENDSEDTSEAGTQYRWLRNGEAISGAATKEYTLMTVDEGQSLTFEVTPVAVSGTLQGPAFLSTVIQVEANAAPVASALRIDDENGGNARLGDLLIGNYQYSDAENNAEGTSQYRWLRNGAVIVNAQQKTYTLQKDDAGKNISFQVTPYAATGMAAGIAKASSTLVINSLPKLIDLSLGVSNAFSGDRISIIQTYQDNENDAAGIHKYQWYRDGVEVSQAYRSYKLTNDDAGKTITVKVTPVAKTGSIEGYQVNVPGSVVVSSNTPPEARNVIITDVNGGDLHPGDTLTATYTYYDADGDLEDNSSAGTLISWTYSLSNSGGYISAGYGKASYVVEGKYLNGSIASSVNVKALTGAKQGAELRSAYMAVVAPDITAPVLTQQVAVSTPTYEKTVAYTFNSTEAGVLALSGKCTPADTSSVIAGNNTLNFGPLALGAYDDCALTVTDAAGNESESLSITAFEIQQPAPIDITLLMNDNFTKVLANDNSDLDVMISSEESCSFFAPNQCAQAEFLDTAIQSATGRLSKTAEAYLRIKKHGIETKNTYISNARFQSSIYHEVSFYDDKFWLLTNYLQGSQSRAFYSSKDGINWSNETSNIPRLIQFFGARGHSQAVYQDKLHFMLGSEHHIYDANAPVANQWTTLALPSDVAFSWYNASYVFNNKLYVFGGLNSSKLFSYDGTSWIKVKDEVIAEGENTVISNSSDFDIVELNGELFMFGFESSNDNSISSNTVFSSSNGVDWSRVNLTGDVFPKGKIYDVEAVEVNNKIVLAFYLKTEQIIFHSNDGRQWLETYQGDQLKSKQGQEWIAVDNQVYALGGGNDNVLISEDGAAFNNIPKFATAPDLNKHRTIEFNQRLWSFTLRQASGTTDFLDIRNTNTGGQWQRVTPVLDNPNSSGYVDREFEVYVWQDKLFVMHGFGRKTIFSTLDGKNWSRETDFPHDLRAGAPEVLNNGDHLLMVGGPDTDKSYRSTDGVNWLPQGAANNALKGLARHQLIKLDSGTLLSIGGATISPSYPYHSTSLAKTFVSIDNGITWQENATANLPEAMDGHQAINFKGKAWLFNKNKAYSFDESSSLWVDRGTILNASTARDHQVVAYKGLLWMTGGSENPNQLYVSDYGAEWYLAKPVSVKFP